MFFLVTETCLVSTHMFCGIHSQRKPLLTIIPSNRNLSPFVTHTQVHKKKQSFYSRPLLWSLVIILVMVRVSQQPHPDIEGLSVIPTMLHYLSLILPQEWIMPLALHDFENRSFTSCICKE